MCACGRFGFEPADLQSGDGAIGPTDVAPVGACGATTVLADDFQATAASASWIVQQSAQSTVAQGAGTMRVTFVPTVQINTLDGYKQASVVDFTGTCSVVDVVGIPSAGTAASVLFNIGTTSVNARFDVGTYAAGTSITSICAHGNLIDHLDSRAYDPVAHRYLRLRNSGGTWFWEVSADGATFTTVASSPCNYLPLGNVLSLWCAANANTSNVGTCTFGAVAITK